MIDIRGLWENFPITATILGVAGIETRKLYEN